MTQLLAPCGHPGIQIIGTYVKCAVGCDGAAPQRHRGEPGHVEMCACRPCQIRRRVVVIELRSRDGQSIRRLPWDGINDKVSFTAAEYAELRHTLWLDANGQVIVRHDAAHTIREGDRIEIVLHPDKVGDAAMLLQVWGEGPATQWIKARKAWRKDLVAKVLGGGGDRDLTVPELIDRLGLRLAAAVGMPHALLMGVDPGYSSTAELATFYAACTRTQVAVMAKTVFGVDEVDVTSPEPNHILVRITQGADNLNRETVDEVRRCVDRVRMIGTSVEVRLDTPQWKLRRALTRVVRELALGRSGWSDVFQAMQRAVCDEGFLDDVVGSVETSISGGGDDPTWRLSVGIEVDGVHYEGRARVDCVSEPKTFTAQW